MPEHLRIGALVRSVIEHLTVHGVEEVRTALGPLVIHGRTVCFAGESVSR